MNNNIRGSSLSLLRELHDRRHIRGCVSLRATPMLTDDDGGQLSEDDADYLHMPRLSMPFARIPLISCANTKTLKTCLMQFPKSPDKSSTVLVVVLEGNSTVGTAKSRPTIRRGLSATI